VGVRCASKREELIICVRSRPYLGYERISLNSDRVVSVREETLKGSYLAYGNVLPRPADPLVLTLKGQNSSAIVPHGAGKAMGPHSSDMPHLSRVFQDV
jgi:hypothetical protein